jgi:hypothetical protein
MMKKTMIIMVTLITLVMAISCSNSAGFIPSYDDDDIGGTVATPVATILDDNTIKLTSTDGATIYYGINGDDASTLYSAPIAITATTTIKAKATKDGWTPSAESATVSFTPKVIITIIEFLDVGYIQIKTTPSDASITYVKGTTTIYGSDTALLTGKNIYITATKEGYIDGTYNYIVE